jgi:hypothetical protein
MTNDDPTRAGFSLKRWSQRKLAAARAATVSPAPPVSGTQVPATHAVPAPATPSANGPASGSLTANAPLEASELPPVDSLTIESNFAAFLQPKVAEGLKRKALKQLFRDPHFNAMDGLDVYIDDYSLPDPIAPELVRELVQSRYVLNPPPTRVNAQGVVEDVPPEEIDKAVPTAEPERLAEPAPNIPSAADLRPATDEPTSRSA